ncbi:hypothetical protein CDL15_Pgr006698 [Punica granatum]|uniref:Uncharacterized protein n=1 Tax=Punica granatum TaxID=22663 RepID=A0A218X796_PUNGR|nr:hypothetical protein CDL15_Pgr006698 [Punica granatum]
MVGIHLERIQASDLGLNAISSFPSLEIFLVKTPYCTNLGLASVAEHCRLRLVLCGTKTLGDAEIACIAAKCTALKKLCIRSCPITDQGVEAVASGCPCLVKVKIKRCKSVTRRAVGWLRARRESLTLDLDTVSDQELGI